MTDVVVVALNINKNDSNFKQFEALPAVEKIAFLKRRIDTLCKELTVSKPNTMWIIAWREYGITGSGPDSRSISYDLKILYKETLLELTHMYPNLTILAGTVSTHRHFTDTSKLATIKVHYEAQKHIRELESKLHFTSDRQIQMEAEKVDTLIARASENTTKSEHDEHNGVDMLRNTAYLVQGQIIQHHDKTTPFNETTQNIEYPDAIYKPGKGSNKRTILDVPHVSFGRPLISLGVEIGRKNNLGV